MSPLYSLPSPAGWRQNPVTNLLLDSRSPYLLQGTAPGAEGVQQAFPATAVDLITALGATGVILPANVLAIYQCDTASPIVDSLGLGPNLVAAGGPLTGRECVGLPTSSFNAKVGCELYDISARFRAALAADFDANNTIRCFLIVCRINSNVRANGHIISKETLVPNVGYALSVDAGGANTGYYFINYTDGCARVNVPVYDGWHSFSCVVDDVARKLKLHSDLGTATSAVLANSFSNNGLFSIGTSDAATWNSQRVQMAYLAVTDIEITDAMRATFWRAFNPAGLGTDPAYARTNPLVTRITNVLGNVACYGASQLPTAYAANASATDNALKTGVVCEDGASFLGLGTTNMPAFVGTSAVVTATDGPSGMRDACRVADTDGVNAGYASSGAANIVGASNVSFVYNAYVKSGGVGANAVFQSYYAGDAGGPETFTNWTIAGAVGAVWRPFAGLAHTPTRPAQTSVVCRLIPTDNVGASLGTVDFAEVWGMQNAVADRATWRRCAAGAASVTSTPSLSYTNVANARYSPTRGRMRLRVSGFAGAGAPVTSPGSPYPVGAGAGPHDICTDGLYQVWAANNNNSTITVYNAATKALRSTFATGASPAHLCADNIGQVWVTCDGANQVYVYNAATLAAIGNYATGANPWGIAADGLGQVWVANFNGNTVTVFNATTKGVIGTYATLVGPRGVAVDDQGQVWVTCQTAGQVRCFNAATKAVVGDYAVGVAPWFAACDRSNQVWIANTNYGVGTTVTVYNTITKALVGTYTVPGISPAGMGVDAFGRIWISCFTSNVLVAVDVTTKALATSVATGNGPNCATVDALGQVWNGVYNGAAGTTIEAHCVRPTFLALGAEGAQGALWADYRGSLALAPLFVGAAQLALRLWDDVAAQVCDLQCGALTAAEAIRAIEWDAVLGKVGVLNGATLLASYAGAWTPEPLAVAPLYVGSDPTPANAARCMISLLEAWNY